MLSINVYHIDGFIDIYEMESITSQESSLYSIVLCCHFFPNTSVSGSPINCQKANYPKLKNISVWESYLQNILLNSKTIFCVPSAQIRTRELIYIYQKSCGFTDISTCPRITQLTMKQFLRNEIKVRLTL